MYGRFFAVAYKLAGVFANSQSRHFQKIYRKIRRISSRRGVRDQLFCHLTFSLYRDCWALGLMCLAGFEAFWRACDQDVCPLLVVSFIPDISCLGLIVFSMFIQAFEWAYASPAIEGDIFACLAVSWFLFAITVDQSAVRSAFITGARTVSPPFLCAGSQNVMVGMELKDYKRDSEDSG